MKRSDETGPPLAVSLDNRAVSMTDDRFRYYRWSIETLSYIIRTISKLIILILLHNTMRFLIQ